MAQKLTCLRYKIGLVVFTLIHNVQDLLNSFVFLMQLMHKQLDIFPTYCDSVSGIYPAELQLPTEIAPSVQIVQHPSVVRGRKWALVGHTSSGIF